MNPPTIASLVVGLILVLLSSREAGGDAQGPLIWVWSALYFLVIPYTVYCLVAGNCTVYAWFFVLFLIPLIAGGVHLSAPSPDNRVRY